jgi:hypothetical protein
MAKLRGAGSTILQSAKDAAGRTTAIVREHSPSPGQFDQAKSHAGEVLKSAGKSVCDLGQEIVQSKPFRDGAKGAVVGATVTLPLPLVGPLFGAAVGAVVAVYFGQQGRSGSDEVLLPAEGSESYVRLRELDDLRRRKILSKEQFEQEVKAVLDSCPPAIVVAETGTPKADQPAAGAS